MDAIVNIYRERGMIICEIPIINLEITCEFITIRELADMRVKVSVNYGGFNSIHFTTRKADLRINTEGLKEIHADDMKTYWEVDEYYKAI